MIIDTYIDRISRTSPMNRCVTVAGLRHGADIDYLDPDLRSGRAFTASTMC